jgi:uncharacterized protein (DUF488 family)
MHNEVTPFFRHFERSEQILIKFAILLQVRLTHAQTFFRGVVFSMKQSFGKITLEQVINNAQVLLSSIAKTGVNGKNRRKC